MNEYSFDQNAQGYQSIYDENVDLDIVWNTLFSLFLLKFSCWVIL